MLSLLFKSQEGYDEERNLFFEIKDFELKLEHSLLSVSKWESIWKTPFLHTVDSKTGKDNKTHEQRISYVECMTLNHNVPDHLYDLIGPSEFKKIDEYINGNFTATWFSEEPSSGKDRTIVTSELIYYWMTSYQIPWEAQKWHLSRLYTLIHICNVKNSKQRKMSKADVMRQNRALNEQRKARYNTKG